MKKTVFLFLAVLPALLVADEITWSGGGGAGNKRWSSGLNWVGGVAPTTGDTAVIPAGATAWASHFDESHGGDMTTINSLAGLRIESGGRVEIDYEQDSASSTCTFSLTTPLYGAGTFVVMNGVNNDRYLRMNVHNPSFNGSFVISNCLMRIKNIKGLGTGCPITIFGDGSNKGLVFETSGIHTNDIVVYGGASNYPRIATPVNSGLCVTNLGSITVAAGCLSFDRMSVAGGLYNPLDGQQSIRMTDSQICGVGAFGGIMLAGNTNFVNAPLHTTEGANAYLIFCSDTRDMWCVMGGSYLSSQCSLMLTRSSTYKCGLTFDLNGYDQAINKLQFGTNKDLNQNMAGVEITSEKPAKLSFKETASSQGPCFGGIITGCASLEMASGMWSGLWFPIVSEGNTTRGSLIVRGGKLWLKPRCTFPRLSAIDIYGDNKYSPVYALVETANVNPGKVSLKLGGDYATLEIADGVQLDAKMFMLNDRYVGTGVYGSAAAHEAHPDLVDENHVLSCLAGTGTVRVRQKGQGGMLLIFR